MNNINFVTKKNTSHSLRSGTNRHVMADHSDIRMRRDCPSTKHHESGGFHRLIDCVTHPSNSAGVSRVSLSSFRAKNAAALHRWLL